MRILTAPASYEFTVKNSRFLAEADYIDSVDAVRELLKQRKERFPDIRHVVHAFAIGQNANILGCSDDGEPSGTAGRPTLEVLKGSGLTNLIITTTRWFGGIKLGTGGLVKAYTEAAQGCLANASSRELVAMAELSFSLPYAIYESVKIILRDLDFNIASEEFLENIRISGSLREELAGTLATQLSDLSRGKIVVEKQNQEN